MWPQCFKYIFCLRLMLMCWLCLFVLTINNICSVEEDPLHLEVRPYIQSWTWWEKKSIRVHLSCISHSIVVLQWDLFSSGRFNTWAGQWKSAIGLDGERRGEDGEGALWGEEQEEKGNSYSKWAYTSAFLCLLGSIIRYFSDNSVEWNKVILFQQRLKVF